MVKIDDLEMDIVAALEAQHLQYQREYGPVMENGSIHSSSDSTVSNASPKESRKHDSKKRWKNWGWKYSPGGKTSSIEEEPESPKKTSRHSSPSNSPKHKKLDSSASSTTNASANSTIFVNSTSPLRRIKTHTNQQQSSQSQSAQHRTDIRSSAGARLCQTFEESQDESGDELQALLANGRPASVHIVPMSSAGISLLNNEV